MRNAISVLPMCAVAGLLPVIAASCAKLSVEHEVKPIHIVADINLRVDRQLDEFFAFEQKYQPPTTGTTTQPAGSTQPSSI